MEKSVIFAEELEAWKLAKETIILNQYEQIIGEVYAFCAIQILKTDEMEKSMDILEPGADY